jgi:succinyl-diaminopimelate desuccinylase
MDLVSRRALGGGGEVRQQPEVDSIVDLARTLIAIPSQGGIDPPDEIIGAIGRWLEERSLTPGVLRRADGGPVGVVVGIGSGSGPTWCLNACLDTAPFGDPAAWSDPPTAGTVRGGWLTGRGAADCKTAVAIFAHIGVEFASRGGDLAGSLTLLFDADEHTGHFGGVRAYTATGARPDGVMIGYPGLDEIVVGARGFWRGRLVVSGRSAHSGSRRAPADNAVVKAATLVRWLSELELPPDDGGDFPLGPKVTVTGISGGDGYSVVPDRCVVAVDVRLTPRHDADWADRLVRQLSRSLDETVPSRQPTTVEPETTWPPYRLPETSRVASALRDGARRALGGEVPAVIAGPSNIGNYLATMGIEATCGFGPAYRNLHGTDEAIDVASVPVVYRAYLTAVADLLADGSPPGGPCRAG